MSRAASGTVRTQLAFISPWGIGFLALMVVPLGYSLVLSLQESGEWSIAAYQRVLADPVFWGAVAVTLGYTAAATVLGLVSALASALLIVRLGKGSALLQSILFFPSVAAGAGLYVLWAWMFEPNVGIINYLLSLIGIDGPGWLTEAGWALPSLVLMSVFFVGQQTVVFVSGLRGVPLELYEAAKLDGAGVVRSFRNVTLPLISPSTFYNLMIMMIFSLQLFAQPFMMTKGGPARATYSMGLYIYDTAFKYGQFGYASALAWVLFLITGILAAVIATSSRKWVHYDIA